jgi:hypothetical protein
LAAFARLAALLRRVVVVERRRIGAIDVWVTDEATPERSGWRLRPRRENKDAIVGDLGVWC